MLTVCLPIPIWEAIYLFSNTISPLLTCLLDPEIYNIIQWFLYMSKLYLYYMLLFVSFLNYKSSCLFLLSMCLYLCYRLQRLTYIYFKREKPQTTANPRFQSSFQPKHSKIVIKNNNLSRHTRTTVYQFILAIHCLVRIFSQFFCTSENNCYMHFTCWPYHECF